jgi:4-amino-4-deoxy-L-arabinose transferase-like glycosyltransferase
MRNEHRIIIALFAIAFGLRILYAVLVGTQPDINPNLVTSCVLYAREMTSGLGWLAEAYSPKAPGYPLLLAAVFLPTGGALWAGIILQAVLGALTVVAVYYLGRRLGGPMAGTVAAVWLSIYVHHAHFSSLLLPDILACLLLAWLVFLLSKPFIKMRYAIYSAIAYTVLVHVDPQYLLLLPFIGLFLLFRATRYMLLNFQYLFLFAGFFVLLCVPWTVRNYTVYRQVIPVSLEASRYIRPLTSSNEAKAKVTGVKSYPGQYQRNAVEYWRVTRFKGEDTGGQAVTSNGRLPEKAWSLRHNVINIVLFGLLLPFFVIGIIYAFRDNERTGQLITLTVVGCFLIRLFYGGSEHTRLPVEPFIILLAFYGLFRLIDRFRGAPEAASDVTSEAISDTPAR